jgi:hypothetical protein
MRKATLALSAVVGLCVVAQIANAQTREWQFGPQISVGTNHLGPAIGGRAVFTGLGAAANVAGLGAYGSLDWYFPSGGSVLVLHANGTWDIPNVTGGAKPYIGAGLGFATSSGASRLGIDLLGGARFSPTPKFNMFTEVRLELYSSSFLAFTVGLLF